MADQLLHSDRQRLKSSEWFQREMFEGHCYSSCSALFYLFYQILMEALDSSELHDYGGYRLLTCRRLNRNVGTKPLIFALWQSF